MDVYGHRDGFLYRLGSLYGRDIGDMVDVTGIFFIPAKRSIGAPYSRSLLPWMPVVPVVNIGLTPT